jgi:hypothetical protein
MKQVKSGAIASTLEEMQAAIRELAAGCALLSTARAVELGRVPVSAEMLLRYPAWVMPRVVKNTRAKRPTYLFDPRDVLALPRVLAEWQRAIADGREDDFANARIAHLAERDMPAKEAA